jgi:Predicted integral membrane protein
MKEIFMKTRQEIKATAKQQFSENYWMSVGAVILAFLIIGAASGVSFGIAYILLAPPIMVGIQYFSLCIYRGESPDLETMFTTGFSNYGRKLGGMLWMWLFTYLWMLLFIIPGIIKAIAYSMTPYILADCPNVNATEALKISMRMTQGHKGEIFVMYLSFIGWFLLSGLTFGLVGIFYTNPYFYISISGLYEELKENALNNGIITTSELA